MKILSRNQLIQDNFCEMKNDNNYSNLEIVQNQPIVTNLAKIQV